MDHLFGITVTDVATTTDDWYTPRWIGAYMVRDRGVA